MVTYPQDKRIEEVTIEATVHKQVCQIDTDEAAFLLTKGAAKREQPDDHRSELKQSPHHDGKVQIFPDEQNAIAYYLDALQTNALLTEDEAYEHLIDAGIDIVGYEQWRTEFSQNDRIQRLINDAKERIDTFGSPWDYAILSETVPFDNITYNPSMRSTSPSDDAVALGKDILEEVPDTTSCYRRAINVLQLVERDNIAYCEGLAMGKHPSRSSTHAWLEVSGEVLELTWPWNGVRPSEKAIYYGDTFPLEHVYRLADSRPVPGSVLLTNEQYFALPEVKQLMADRVGHG